MWELDHKESCARNSCFWTVVLEKTFESPLDGKEIKPVNPKGNQTWIFIGRTDAEAEMPMLWPPHAKSWLIGKDPDAGRDWEQEEKRTTEDEIGWMASPTQWTWVSVNFRVGDGQGGLVCCDSWGLKESDTTEQLNWTFSCILLWLPHTEYLLWCRLHSMYCMYYLTEVWQVGVLPTLQMENLKPERKKAQ